MRVVGCQEAVAVEKGLLQSSMFISVRNATKNDKCRAVMSRDGTQLSICRKHMLISVTRCLLLSLALCVNLTQSALCRRSISHRALQRCCCHLGGFVASHP